MSKLSFVSFVFISKEVEEMLNSMTNYACSLMLTMPSATPEASDSVQLPQHNPHPSATPLPPLRKKLALFALK